MPMSSGRRGIGCEVHSNKIWKYLEVLTWTTLFSVWGCFILFEVGDRMESILQLQACILLFSEGNCHFCWVYWDGGGVAGGEHYLWWDSCVWLCVLRIHTQTKPILYIWWRFQPSDCSNPTFTFVVINLKKTYWGVLEMVKTKL